MREIMSFKTFKSQILRGSVATRVLPRVSLFALAMAIIIFLQPLCEYDLGESSDGSAFRLASDPVLSKLGQLLKPALPLYPQILWNANENFAADLFRELMAEKLLKSGSKVLCVGDGSASFVSALRELGFPDSLKAHLSPFMHGLEFKDNSFDFVFSTDIDRVSVPALLVLEIERVLRTGGVAAMLVAVGSSSYRGNFIKAATPISTFLKSSNVVHARNVYSSSLVVFKKKLDNNVGPFGQYKLPDECPCVENNKPFIKHLEPLLGQKPVRKSRISYLPKFMNVSSRSRFVYIDVGAGNLMNSNTKNRFLSTYPEQTRAFDVYIVHHDTSFLSAYVKRPGITFVYHPGLAGTIATGNFDHFDDLGPLVDDQEFDFIVWFRKTVAAGDFVILKMNAVGEELKLLHRLFESGAICLVDELFLRCADGKGDVHGECVDLMKSMRNRGVFVHQLLDE